MNLEQLMNRKIEIEKALASTSNQYQVLLVHKNEIDFQIEQLAAKPVETQVEVPVE